MLISWYTTRVMQTYELTLVTPVLAEAKQKAFADKIAKLLGEAGGKVEKTDEWGKREFAYPIKKQREGVYYFYALSLDPDRISALNRVLQNDEEVLRHMVIKGEKAKSLVQVQEKLKDAAVNANGATKKVVKKKETRKPPVKKKGK